MKKLNMVVEAEIKKIDDRIAGMPEDQRKQRTVDCKPGCSYCCHLCVGVAIPEAIAIGDWIRANCTDEQIQLFIANAERYQQQLDATPDDIEPIIPCPVLINDLCAIHPGRPMVCRGYNSLDVEKCKEKNEARHNIPIPFLPYPRQITDAMLIGVMQTMGKKGLQNGSLVLGLALKIVLEDPKAGEKYFAGEPVFDPAMRPERFKASNPMNQP